MIRLHLKLCTQNIIPSHPIYIGELFKDTRHATRIPYAHTLTFTKPHGDKEIKHSLCWRNIRYCILSRMYNYLNQVVCCRGGLCRMTGGQICHSGPSDRYSV